MPNTEGGHCVICNKYLTTGENWCAECLRDNLREMWLNNPYRDQPFKPFVTYNVDGDLIECFLTNEDYYGEYINENLTVYYRDDGIETKNKKIVGFCITWIKDLMRQAMRPLTAGELEWLDAFHMMAASMAKNKDQYPDE